MKKVINRGKRNKTLKEIKPVKNISKNLQSFLEISPVHQNCQNQKKNSHNLFTETGYSIVSLMESQWKLRQHDQNFPMEEKPL